MWRIILYIILSFFILLILSFSLLYLKYPPEFLMNKFIKKIGEELNTKIKIKDISYTWSGFFKIKNIEIHINQYTNENSQPDLSIGEIGILFHPSSLWSKKIDIYSLYIQDLNIKIIQNKNNKYNWIKFYLSKKVFKNTNNKIKKNIYKASIENLFKKRFFISNISLKNIILDLDTFSTASINGKYRLDSEINLNNNNLKLKLDVLTQNKKILKIDSIFFIPATLPKLIKNYTKIIRNLSYFKMPASQLDVIFYKFPITYVYKFLSKTNISNIIQNINGKISFITKNNHKKIWINFHKINCRLNKKYKKLKFTLKGKSIYNLTKKNIVAKKIKLQLKDKSSIEFKNLTLGQKTNIRFEALVNFKLNNFKRHLSKNRQLKGQLSSSILYNKLKKQLKADILLKDFVFYQNKIPMISSDNVVIRYEDYKITIPKTNLTFMKQKLSFKANSKDLSKKGSSLFYNLEVQKWDMNQIIKMINSDSKSKNIRKNKSHKQKDISKEKFQTISLLRSFLPISLYGNINIGSLLFSKLNLNQLSIKTSFQDNLLKINQFSFSLAYGLITGNYRLRFGNPNINKRNRLKHTFYLKIKSLKLHKLFELFKNDNKIYASYSGELVGKMEGSSLKEFSESLNSKFIMKTSKGKMLNTFLQKGILNGVLGHLESKLSHLDFLNFKAEILTRKGNIYLQTGKFISSDFSLSMTGKFDWDLFGDAYIRFKFNDKFIENIASPVRLGINSTYQEGQYILPFSCLQNKIIKSACWQADWR